MKQVVQPAGGGPVRVLELPEPVIEPTQVLVRTIASVISPGTERAITTLAQSSLLGKARARPDLVRQVIDKVKTDGLVQTSRAVRTRLGQDLPLGYSGAGLVVQVGEATMAHKPGDLVATGGAGWANHAEYQAVPGLLCARVPGHVPAEDAAFATIASVALHGLRLAGIEAGSKIAIIGLGLVGQLVARLAGASGCEVAAIDVLPSRVEAAARSAALALVETGMDTTRAIADWTRGRGADAVLVAASGASSAPMLRAPELSRDRATVVVLGDTGLQLNRRPFYEKELSLKFARSYGPGRYERSYEGWGVDLPAGHVRWTEGRNLEAVVDLLASGRLQVADLVTHRFGIEGADEAYRLSGEEAARSLGVLLTYPKETGQRPETPIRAGKRKSGQLGIGLIGAGSFASSVLVPAFRRAGVGPFVAVASASGVSAGRLAEREGFERAVGDAQAVIESPDVDIVVVATPHELHARLASAALRAGKHVYCEKPLALSVSELDEVEAALSVSKSVLFVGFNRRFSEPLARVKRHLASGGSGPLVISYRVNAGRFPESHWYSDRRQGGRLLGEVCHFVDACSAIAGHEVLIAHAFGDGPRERLLAENIVVTLQFGDGSVASIAYASGGGAAMAKERIEVMGRGRSAAIDDFGSVTLDGEISAIRPRDKGADAIVRAFAAACRGETAVEAWPITSTLATLHAAAALVGPRNPAAD